MDGRGGNQGKVAIQPDAFFQLKDTRLPDGQNRHSFFLEADRSTMPTQPRPGSQRFRDKIDRYRWFIDCGRPFERYGVRSIRILTLTLAQARRDNLAADTDAFLVENNLTRLGNSSCSVRLKMCRFPSRRRSSNLCFVGRVTPRRTHCFRRLQKTFEDYGFVGVNEKPKIIGDHLRTRLQRHGRSKCHKTKVEDVVVSVDDIGTCMNHHIWALPWAAL